MASYQKARIRVAEKSDKAFAYAHSSKPDKVREMIYSGTLLDTCKYASTMFDRTEYVESFGLTTVEVVLNGNVVTTFVTY